MSMAVKTVARLGRRAGPFPFWRSSASKGGVATPAKTKSLEGMVIGDESSEHCLVKIVNVSNLPENRADFTRKLVQ